MPAILPCPLGLKAMVRSFVVLLIAASGTAAIPPDASMAETVDIEIYKFEFIPAQVTIAPGDTIRWINREIRQYHSVWFEQAGVPESDYFFPGESYSQTFDKRGDYPYRCGPHPAMTGTITVK